jgi:hypothetical protein
MNMKHDVTIRPIDINLATAIDILSEVTRFSEGAALHKTARQTEATGFSYAAAMQWRKAAELFESDPWLSEACWQQWERVMNLSRVFASAL